MENECKLCGKMSVLSENHIVPAFVGKWIKETSPSKYLRQGINPNKRMQDLLKQKLLCSSCELQFSQFEKEFAEKLFNPYVYTELDEWSVGTGTLKNISYKDWLIKFVISLQWRALVSGNWEGLGITKGVNDKFPDMIIAVEKDWRNFLLGKTQHSGDSRHYILFLQNLAAGQGYLPEGIHPQVNVYLCRAVDSTIAFSNKNMFLFTKMGPIVIVSGLIPNKLDGMNDSLVHMRGQMPLAQRLSNPLVNEFLFITRPKETMDLYKISDKQQQKIEEEVSRGIEGEKGANAILVSYSDFMMSKGKRML